MNKRNRNILILLICYHAVGVAGFLIPDLHELFQAITPWNILASLAFALAFHKKWKGEFVISSLLVAVCGFAIEVAGVKSGLIFGHYTYGPTLGIKLWDVPLLMAANWLLMLYLSTQLVQGWTKEPLMKAALSAAVMTAYDVFLEPVAMKFGFWNWEGNVVPMRNYLAWFVLSLILQYFYQKQGKFSENKPAVYLLIIQMIFFAIIGYPGWLNF